MIPIRDHNPTRRTPFVTLALIALNVTVWLGVQGLGGHPALAESVCTLGLIPGEFLGTLPAGTTVPLGPEATCVLGGSTTWYTPLTSMFLHGGWMHLLGNLWFLWIFGDNVEESYGHIRFALFYVACGLVAAAAQLASAPESALPMVGASGAIGGVMGAYAVLFPRARIDLLLLIVIVIRIVPVPAYLMLGYWFLIQLVLGLPALGDLSAGVAFWAHTGGFVAGALSAWALRRG